MGLLLLFNSSVQGSVTTDLPDLYLEWSPTTGPRDVPIWERIPLADIRSIDINRGRNRELDRFQAGRMTCVLDNRDRLYDPRYSAGANFGNVKPMKRIRLRAVWDNTYDLFTGFVDSWDQDYGMPNEATCTVTATDGFKVIEAFRWPSSVYAQEVLVDNPAHWWRMGDRVGSTVAIDHVLRPANGNFSGQTATFGVAGLNDLDAVTACKTVGLGGFDVPAVASLGSEHTAFTIETLVVSHGTGISTGTARVYFQDTTPGVSLSLLHSGLGNVFAWEGLTSTTTHDVEEVFHVVGVYDNGTASLYINGVLEATGAADGTTAGDFIIARSAPTHSITTQEIAVYHTALSAERIAAHYDATIAPWNGDTTGERIERFLDAIGWPAADRDVDAGESTLQTATFGSSPLADAQVAADTEYGELFILPNGSVRFIGRHNKWLPPYNDPQVTLSDDGSDIGYGRLRFNYDDQLIRNRVTIGYENGTSYTANSTSSQDDFLIKSYGLSGLPGDVDTEGVDYAHYVLGRYDQPLLRVEGISITPQKDPDVMWPAVLAADLVYQVNVERTPQGVGTAIDQDYTIEGVSHHIEPKFWRTNLQLSPADTPGAWIWDSTSQGIWDTNVWGF